MAGNIIPAIATSNALTASLCVLEAFKIIRSSPQAQTGLSKPTANNALPTTTHTTVSGLDEGILGGSKMAFLNSKSTDRMITTQALSGPNPDCPVCSPVYAKLQVSEGSPATLQDLVSLLDGVVGSTEFSITTEAGVIFDPDLDDNLSKTLSELGIDGTSNGFLTIMDDADEAKVDLVLSVTSQPAVLEGDGLALLPKNIHLPLKPRKKAPEAGDDDAVKVNGHAAVAAASAGAKRKREATEDLVQDAKKARISEDEVFVIEDDGAILLDD